MKHILIASVLFVAACAPQSTPSMVNTARPQVLPQTTMEQMLVEKVNDNYLYKVSTEYDRYGSDTLQLALAYDPASKTYSAMKAFSDLAEIKTRLKKFGVRSITAETVKVEGSAPTLMVSYDGLVARAPEGCRTMPGFEDGLTTREIGNYKFGCSVDTMLANQIYRPADLLGNGASDPGDGRRASNNVEYYRQIEPDEAEGELNRIERTEIQP